MLFSKKYRRLLPLHLLLVITGVQVGELIKSDNFVLEETLCAGRNPTNLYCICYCCLFGSSSLLSSKK